MRESNNYWTISLISHMNKVHLYLTKDHIQNYYHTSWFQRGTMHMWPNREYPSHHWKTQNTVTHWSHVSPTSQKHLTLSTYYVWRILTDMGIPKQLIANLYHQQLNTEWTAVGESEWFSNWQGVRQGCILSPGLFYIFAEFIRDKPCKILTKWKELGFPWVDISTDLRYPDDTAFYTTPTDVMQQNVGLRKNSEEYGIFLNVAKTTWLITLWLTTTWLITLTWLIKTGCK